MQVPTWAALWSLRVAAGPVLNPNLGAAVGPTADVSPTGGVCLTQWYTPGSGANNVRSYHTRSDGSIVESRRGGDGTWTSAAIVLKDQWGWSGNASEVRAWAGGPLACAGEAVGDGPDDVQIRLFYQRVEEEGGLVKLHSIVWKSDIGWRPDEAFDTLFGRRASAGAAIKWVDPRTRDVDWRLYYVLYDRLQYGTTRVRAHVHEAVLRTRGGGADAEVLAWQHGSDDKPVAELVVRPGRAASVAAACLRGGRHISLVAWTLRTDPGATRGGSSSSSRRPAAIQETRWTAETGRWTSRAQTLVGSGFSDAGAVAVAPYRERASGRDVLLTVVRYHEPYDVNTNTAVQQLVSVGDMWLELMMPPPRWLAAAAAAEGSMAAAAWLGKSGGQEEELHITLHYAACDDDDDGPDGAEDGNACNFAIKEAQRNTENVNGWIKGPLVST